jgi:Fe-S cluster assembly protein SufD
MDIQDFIQRYPQQAHAYTVSTATSVWQQHQKYASSAAYASRTLVISISAGVHVSEPIQLQSLLGHSSLSDTYDACIIILEPYAQATFVDTYSRLGGTHAWCIIAHVGDHANLCMLYDQYAGDHTTIEAAYLFRCGQASNTTVTYLMHSHAHADIRFDVQLVGADAQAHIQGLYALSGTAHTRIMTEQTHQVRDTTSSIRINGLLTGSADATYHGRIHIVRDAHGSVAHQRNHTLLVSETAQTVSTPSLEALAHQVQCVHASAVGTLDTQALAYLMMRGMAVTEARRLLLHGFIHSSVGTQTTLEASTQRIQALF